MGTTNNGRDGLAMLLLALLVYGALFALLILIFGGI